MDVNNFNIKQIKFFCFTCIKNGRNFITKLFDSMLNQTKINFVHYIYDDGSDAPSYDLIKDYKQKCSYLKQPFQIIYEYNKKNIGLNRATQHCISKVNLPYFIWINCDDWLDKNFFKEAEKFVDKHPEYGIYEANTFDYNNGKISNFYTKKMRRYLKHHKKRFDLYITDRIKFAHFIVNTKQYFKINPKNLLLNERHFFNDMQVFLMFILNNLDFAFMDKAYTNFLRRNEGESQYYSSIKKISKLNYLAFGNMLKIKNITKFIDIYFSYNKIKNSVSEQIKIGKYNEALKIYKARNEFLSKYKLTKKMYIGSFLHRFILHKYLIFKCYLKSK